MKTLDDIGDIKSKRVIVRGSLNVPVENGQVVDSRRIEITLLTVNELISKGAKVILIGHIGRDPKESLEPVMRYLQNFVPVVFVPDIFSDDAKKAIDLVAPGTIVLLENLRRWEGETKNDEDFAKKLASFGDFYVNEAFDNCHREHASMVSLPKLLPHYAGRQLVKEIENLSKAFNPEHPFVFILGGAKVETKLPLIKEFKGRADKIFIGGVLANDFLKAKGLEVGKSVVSGLIPEKDLLKDKSIVIPEDIIVYRQLDNLSPALRAGGGKSQDHQSDNFSSALLVGGASSHNKSDNFSSALQADDGVSSKKEKLNIKIGDVQVDDYIYDIGQESTKKILNEIKKAKVILWNGPLGYCEKGFFDSTLDVAKNLANSDVISIIGGGDTLAAVPEEIQEKMTFISIGGGAMLDFLAKKTLPAIDILEN